MRIIELKFTQLESGQPFVYRDALINAVKIPARGMNIDDMEKALPIIAAIRGANGKVVLEDTAHQLVVQRLGETVWMMADPAIVQFVKDVRDAPPMDANALLDKK